MKPKTRKQPSDSVYQVKPARLEPKPDRLLTEKQILKVIKPHQTGIPVITAEHLVVRNAQLVKDLEWEAKTASIIRAETERIVARGYIDPATGKKYDAVQTEFGLKMIPQVEAERLDRPELREKIAKLLCAYEYSYERVDEVQDGEIDLSQYELADKILALIPDVDKVVAEIFEEIEQNFLVQLKEDAIVGSWQALKARGGK